ncbi:unnamed protein product [Sphagnum tenellum]
MDSKSEGRRFKSGRTEVGKLRWSEMQAEMKQEVEMWADNEKISTPSLRTCSSYQVPSDQYSDIILLGTRVQQQDTGADSDHFSKTQPGWPVRPCTRPVNIHCQDGLLTSKL